MKSVAALLNFGKYPLNLYFGFLNILEGTRGGGGGVGVSNSRVSRKHPEELERCLRPAGVLLRPDVSW